MEIMLKYITGMEKMSMQNGEEISADEYNARLNNVYPTQQATYPEKYYILKDIYSILRTGDVSSAGHRYELVIEDLTWTEADIIGLSRKVKPILICWIYITPCFAFV